MNVASPPSMAPLKIRQRYILPQDVYGISVEVESPINLETPALALAPSPLSSCSGSSSSSSSTPSSAILWRHRVENVLWIASAIFILYYGDFRSNFFALLANDPRVRRIPLHIGLVCLILDIGIFLFLALRLRILDRIEERLDVVAPGAIPAATMIGLAGFILFSVALWPIWNILTVPMLFTLFMAFVVVAPYLPPYVDVKVDADSIRCLYIRSE